MVAKISPNGGETVRSLIAEQVIESRRCYELLSEYASLACSDLAWDNLMPSGVPLERVLQFDERMREIYGRIRTIHA